MVKNNARIVRNNEELFVEACRILDGHCDADCSVDELCDEIRKRNPNICDRALHLIKNAQLLLNPSAFIDFFDVLYNGFDGEMLDKIKSPIEQIFFVAILSIIHEKYLFHTLGISIEIISQQDISVNGYNYVPDFSFRVYLTEIDKKLSFYSNYDNFISSVCVECDGKDFHQKTNIQISNGNRKSNNMQVSGHTILKFSGSDIFNYPYECAENAYCAIIKNLKNDLLEWSKTVELIEEG